MRFYLSVCHNTWGGGGVTNTFPASVWGTSINQTTQRLGISYDKPQVCRDCHTFLAFTSPAFPEKFLAGSRPPATVYPSRSAFSWKSWSSSAEPASRAFVSFNSGPGVAFAVLPAGCAVLCLPQKRSGAQGSGFGPFPLTGGATTAGWGSPASGGGPACAASAAPNLELLWGCCQGLMRDMFVIWAESVFGLSCQGRRVTELSAEPGTGTPCQWKLPQPGISRPAGKHRSQSITGSAGLGLALSPSLGGTKAARGGARSQTTHFRDAFATTCDPALN